MSMTPEADALQDRVNALLVGLRAGNAQARQNLLALCGGPQGARARELLDTAQRGELLETKWEIEDILEATSPKKAEPEAPELPPEEEAELPPDPNRPLTSADLDMVYDDPRGLMLHKSKVGNRWFATQTDPHTGQPQTFELHPQEIQQIKTQLMGSPYWLVGGGA